MKLSKHAFPENCKAIFPSCVLIIILAIYIIGGWLILKDESDFVEAQNGYIYCSNIDGRNPISLRGHWEYYPNRMLFSSDFYHEGGNRHGYTPEYIYVPGEAPNQTGFGTYRLLFKTITTSDTFALKISDIWSSARIYLDGRLVGSIGDPSTMTNGSLPWNSAKYITFTMDVYKTTHELIIQTSNYDYLVHGITSPIYFGTQLELYDLTNSIRLSEAICAMCVIVLAVLVLVLCVMRIQISNLVYLVLFSFCFGIYLLTCGEKLLLNIFESMPYLLFIRLRLALVPAMFLFISNYVCDFGEAGRMINIYKKVTTILSGICILALAFAPQSLLVHAYSFSTVVNIAWCAVSIYCMIKKLLHQETAVIFQIMGVVHFICIFFIFKLYSEGKLYSLTRTTLLAYMSVGFVLLQLIYVAQKVSYIYSANEHLAQRMVVSDKLKSELMAIVSHELRTPLHGIINITQSVIEDLCQQSGVDKTSQTEELQLSISLARRMSGIVTDLYDFVEQNYDNDIDVRPTNLRVEVNAVFEMFRYSDSNNALHFINAIPLTNCTVFADENKLWQILCNLISNAIKYTPSGTITVSSQRDNDMITIMVTDTGIGMKPELQDYIFKRYARIPSMDSQTAGSGLGLYIAKKLVEEMSGSICIKWTEENVGSCFAFTLKACDQAVEVNEFAYRKNDVSLASSLELASNTMLPICPDSANLLIADDNPVNLKIVARIFQDCNFKIDLVGDGDEAVRLINDPEKHYDVVLLDVMMPRMNGFEACRAIRTQYSHFELPILMLTARDQVKDIVTGFWAGANDYVTKPVDNLELRARVFTLINLKKSVSVAIKNELAFLQAQIHPHFLYNAFNTISAISLTDGIAASELIDDLGVYLRSIFKRQTDSLLVPLAKEIETTEAYLHIEKARFGEKLQITWDIKAPLNTSVPSLIIQPLVENSVRHGSLGQTGCICIHLSARIENDDLLIEVFDNGSGIQTIDETAASSKKTLHDNNGIGLKNINRRLRLRYNRELEIQSNPSTGTHVLMRIPVSVQKL